MSLPMPPRPLFCPSCQAWQAGCMAGSNAGMVQEHNTRLHGKRQIWQNRQSRTQIIIPGNQGSERVTRNERSV
jgi:hypothetical protein